MSSPALEAFIARLLVDEAWRQEFHKSPRHHALHYGLSEAEAEAIAHADLVGIEMAASSLKRKKAQRTKKK